MERLPRGKPAGQAGMTGILPHGILGFVAGTILEGIDGVTGGIFGLDELADRLRGTQDLTNHLADVALTDVTTPFYASSGAKDMCTFNRTQLVPDEDGNPPSYTPSKSVFSVFFLRADRSGDFSRFKVIMGGDTSWFDIDHCYMALYRVHPVTGFMTREWISADLDATLGSTRKEYSINMGKIVSVVQDEILALGQVQVAPGLAQTPRSLATLKQNGIELPPGTVPAFTGGYRSGTTMPATIAMSDLTPFQNNVLWFALSP